MESWRDWLLLVTLAGLSTITGLEVLGSLPCKHQKAFLPIEDSHPWLTGHFMTCGSSSCQNLWLETCTWNRVPQEGAGSLLACHMVIPHSLAATRHCWFPKKVSLRLKHRKQQGNLCSQTKPDSSHHQALLLSLPEQQEREKFIPNMYCFLFLMQLVNLMITIICMSTISNSICQKSRQETFFLPHRWNHKISSS